MARIDAAVDDRQRHSRPRRGHLIRADRGEPPLLVGERIAGRPAGRRRGRPGGAEGRQQGEKEPAAHGPAHSTRLVDPDTLDGMARAHVALGSNLGDREATIRAAVAELAATPGIELLAVSSLVETEPVGYLDQPRFLNGAAALETSLDPRRLLELLLAVERRFGRVREGGPAQGPRTLDLDLLLYGDLEIDEEGLQIPHPRLHERGFVLGPLAELDPGLEVPRKGQVQTLLAGLH
jgi:2-amino-4-hydroxy-6-hydroxymethyldihydropteridine diphosphokinase